MLVCISKEVAIIIKKIPGMWRTQATNIAFNFIANYSHAFKTPTELAYLYCQCCPKNCSETSRV